MGQVQTNEVSFADRVKSFRKCMGFSQSQASKELEMPVQTLQSWEAERYIPRNQGMVRRLMGQIEADFEPPMRKPTRKERFSAVLQHD